jgi:hypothetical protein
MQKVPGKFNGDVGAELNLTGEGIEVCSCISETGGSDFTWVVTLHTDSCRNKGGIAILVSGITDIVRVCTPESTKGEDRALTFFFSRTLESQMRSKTIVATS